MFREIIFEFDWFKIFTVCNVNSEHLIVKVYDNILLLGLKMNHKSLIQKQFGPLTLSGCPLLIRPDDGKFLMSIGKLYYLRCKSR